MNIYDYQQAFQAADKTSKAMKNAIAEWFDTYYGKGENQQDPCQRLGYTIVNKLLRAVFGEYQTYIDDKAALQALRALEDRKKEALQLALVGGECYIKPYVTAEGFGFTLIPRDHILIFGRDGSGNVTDMGTAQQVTKGNEYFTLLERRRLNEQGFLVLENRLYRSKNAERLGDPVPLTAVEAFAALPETYIFPVSLGGVGVVGMKTPMLNCVDGSQEGVCVYGAAMDLIRRVDENEKQLREEFKRGESRVIASADLLDSNGGLTDHLFVGLDEDPETVGITVYSPELRADAYILRKREYLRNVESVVGLRRGMLSEVNNEERTAAEITSSAGDFNLTVIEFQQMWEKALHQVLRLCGLLAPLYGLPALRQTEPVVDWGNSTLYDEDKLWQDYRQMVLDGLIAPEVALGWRFNMPAGTEEERKKIREMYMP